MQHILGTITGRAAQLWAQLLLLLLLLLAGQVEVLLWCLGFQKA